MKSSNKVQSKDRITIGYLGYNVRGPIGAEIFSGVLSAAKELDINLICIEAGVHIEATKYNTFNKKLVSSYEFINKNNFDGLLIWATSLQLFLDLNKIDNFFHKFKSIPMVSIAQSFPEVPGILCDDFHGIGEIMKHLIEDHGFKKIAFIKGPKDNLYSKKRYQAYIDVLKKYKIPIKEDLITPDAEDFNPPCGKKAVEILFNERNFKPKKDIEAIITASDLLTLGCMIKLQELGYNIPNDIALCGFNNSKEGMTILPRLTTVDPNFKEQGYKAVELLISKIKGNEIDINNYIPSKLIIRQSCGCLEKDIENARFFDNNNYKGFTYSGENFFDLIEKYKDKIIDTLNEKAKELTLDINNENISKLFDDFVSSIKEESKYNFLNKLDFFLNQMKDKENLNEIAKWQNFISSLQKIIFPYFDNQINMFKTLELINQARILLNHTAVYIPDSLKEYYRQRSNLLSYASSTLSTEITINGLLDEIVRFIPKIGFNDFFLVLYDTNIKHKCKLLLSIKGKKRIETDVHNSVFNSDYILPEKYLYSEKPYFLILEPCFMNEKILGYFLINIEINLFYQNVDLTRQSIDISYYENIRIIMSSAINSVLYFRQIEEARKQQVKLLKKQEQLRNEMEIAQRIQVSMLPFNVEHNDLHITCLMKTSEQVGGDYYDIVYDSAKNLWFAIGDVSGHGVTPGLITMMAHTSLNSLLRLDKKYTPKEIYQLLNNVLFQNIKRMSANCYMTMYLLKYEGNGNFSYSGCHNDLIIYRDSTKKCHVVENEPGMWLAVLDNVNEMIKNFSLFLDKNDILILYTDGIIEAKNKKREEFGVERLMEIIEDNRNKDIVEIKNEVLNYTLEWCDNKQADDITLVLVKRIK
ncbi:MAG: SpoIIE family protein phosphatase [Spirochaetes bacterium]|nr:SpoIIE family protein phosphatase [Spirochaetota bacterium]